MKRPLSLPRRGFTLVELLAVIAIIAILATLTLYLVNDMTEKARQAKSIANMRSLGDAFQMYANDNDGLYPPRPRGVPSSAMEPKYEGWVAGSLNSGNFSARDGALFEYVGDEEVFISPSQVAAYEHEDVEVVLSYAIQRKVYEGSGNHYQNMPVQGGGYLQYPKPQNVIQPHTKIFMVEQVNADDGLYHELGDRGANYGSTGEIVRGRDALFWHNDVSHMLFYDGHVEAMEYDDPRADPLEHSGWEPGIRTKRD
jgi:prepilin-type N-terminal cleavage/methylation domain-containing protein/prepilin-type processing-associated H-X9-DG protein